MSSITETSCRMVSNDQSDQKSIRKALEAKFPSSQNLHYHLSVTHPNLGKWYDNLNKPWDYFKLRLYHLDHGSGRESPLITAIKVIALSILLGIPAIAGKLMTQLLDWKYGQKISQDEIERQKQIWIQLISENSGVFTRDAQVKFIETCIRHKIEINTEKSTLFFSLAYNSLITFDAIEGSGFGLKLEANPKYDGKIIVVLSPTDPEGERRVHFKGIDPDDMEAFKNRYVKGYGVDEIEKHLLRCELLYFPPTSRGTAVEAARIRKVFREVILPDNAS